MTRRVVVSVIDVNEPPVFHTQNITFSTTAIAVPGQSVGVPLSTFVTDPDTASILTYSLSSGWCGFPQSQLGPNSAVLPHIPFNVSTSGGFIRFAAIITATPLSVWRRPVLMCATVIDRGDLSANANITVDILDVAQSLSVYPDRVTVSHFSCGVSHSELSVSYYAGSVFGGRWLAQLSDPTPLWCAINQTAAGVSVVFNSSRICDLVHTGAFSAGATVLTVKTAGERGLI